jgi:DHA1 family bicyclomycin/chloramphenicol resistance-like MFS transporter
VASPTSETSKRQSGRDTPSMDRLTLLLGCLAALPPLAIETSLPAIPAIAQDLRASASATQWSFTGMFLGMALSQLLAGPLCDRFGRRPILLWGLFIFVVAGIGCTLSPSVEVLIACRFLQGFGAAVGVLISKAVPRDVWVGAAATSKLSFITSMSTAAMLAGPMIGSLLLLVLDWRGLFAVLPLAGFVLWLVALRNFNETLPIDRRFQGSYTSRYLSVLRQRRSMAYFIANSCLFAAMIAFITGSPMIFIVTFQFDLLLYGLTYGLAIGCVTLGSFANGILAHRWPSRQRLMFGVSLAAASMIILGFTAFQPNPATALLGGALLAGSCGLNYPNSQAAGLSSIPQHAGVGAGVIGTLAYMMGAISSGAIGFLGPGSPAILVAIMVAFSALGISILTYITVKDTYKGEW